MKTLLFLIIIISIQTQASEINGFEYIPEIRRLMKIIDLEFTEEKLRLIKPSSTSKFIEEYYPFIHEYTVYYSKNYNCYGTVRINVISAKIVGFDLGNSSKKNAEECDIKGSLKCATEFLLKFNPDITLEKDFQLVENIKVSVDSFAFSWKRMYGEYPFFWDRLIVHTGEKGEIDFYINENFSQHCPLVKNINMSEARDAAVTQLKEIYEKKYQVVKLGRALFWNRDKCLNGTFIFNINDFPFDGVIERKKEDHLINEKTRLCHVMEMEITFLEKTSPPGSRPKKAKMVVAVDTETAKLAGGFYTFCEDNFNGKQAK